MLRKIPTYNFGGGDNGAAEDSWNTVVGDRATLKNDIHRLPDIEGSSSKKISLKLKNAYDEKRYILALPITTTIDNILDHLQKYVKTAYTTPTLLGPLSLGSSAGDFRMGISSGFTRYEIVLPHPFGVLSSAASTLQDYGIVTNTLLYFQPRSCDFSSTGFVNDEL